MESETFLLTGPGSRDFLLIEDASWPWIDSMGATLNYDLMLIEILLMLIEKRDEDISLLMLINERSLFVFLE